MFIITYYVDDRFSTNKLTYSI